MRSKAYQREPPIVTPLLVSVLWSLIGCTPKQEVPPRLLHADFNVVAAPDGRTVVWLRMSGPDFAAMVHQSAAKPQFGGMNDLVHKRSIP